MTVTSVQSSTTMADQYRGGHTKASAVHRKPAPVSGAGGPINHYQNVQQSQYYQPSSQPFTTRSSSSQAPQFTGNAAPAGTSSHSRTRTTSSSVFPDLTPTALSPNQASQDHRNPAPANGTMNNQPNPQSQMQQSYVQRSGTNNSTGSARIRRSSSSRTSSVLPQASYVALMRKQKATVWCDRSQTVDSRTLAQQRAAKHRAALEVHGAGSTARTSTIGSGSKMRSGKSGGLTPANYSGVSVPIRLSANEMLGDEEEVQEGGRGSFGGDAAVAAAGRDVYQRSGSGRSSVYSGPNPPGHPRSDTVGFGAAAAAAASGAGGGGIAAGSFSNNSSPPSGNDLSDHMSSSGATHPLAKSSSNVSSQINHHNDRNSNDSSNGNGNSGEEDRFGKAGELKPPPQSLAVASAAEQARRAEELRRRGSVDERTMTMGGKGRLFVANPDLDD